MVDHKDKPDKEIHFFVDGEKEATSESVLTPTQIMSEAGVDPATNYLEQRTPEKKSYQETPNEPIEMKNGMHFITKPKGPMTVSAR